MRRTFLAVVALGLAGCGSDKLNPAFVGVWTGPVVLTMGTGTYTGTVRLSVTLPSETTATLSPVCLDSTGSITATGSGDSASWAGTMVCPPVGIGQCAAVTLTLTSGKASLSSDGKTLSGQAFGTASGCSTNTNFSWTFTGVK